MYNVKFIKIETCPVLLPIQALKEEQQVLDRCSNRSLYLNLASRELRKLRSLPTREQTAEDNNSHNSHTLDLTDEQQSDSNAAISSSQFYSKPSQSLSSSSTTPTVGSSVSLSSSSASSSSSSSAFSFSSVHQMLILTERSL